MVVEVGLAASASFTGGGPDTAAALGSGDVSVLGTPRLIAWCEEVTLRALAGHLAEDVTTVGTRIELDHLAATPVGTQVSIDVVLSTVEGRNLQFDVHAWQHNRVTIARGVIRRVLVDRQEFLARLRDSA